MNVSTWVLPSGGTVGRQAVRERRLRALPKGTIMQFTSEQRLDDGVIEREFTLGDIPGTLWTPDSAGAAGAAPVRAAHRGRRVVRGGGYVPRPGREPGTNLR
ncbi:hypothetical protein GCM10010349_59610 [Streptomyces flavofungini]|nr:hypothetical protein GCM10010349_59610 [Streptomyces flavofungini]